LGAWQSLARPARWSSRALFLNDCISAHGADLLTANLVRYRRFIWAIDAAPLFEDPSLPDHLRDWQAAVSQWLALQEDLPRPLAARWLAHRFATPMVKGRGELREAADCIVHLYGPSLRIAAAIGAVFKRLSIAISTRLLSARLILLSLVEPAARILTVVRRRAGLAARPTLNESVRGRNGRRHFIRGNIRSFRLLQRDDPVSLKLHSSVIET